ncbi:MAG TPA: helix-turn-helix domain-containing protein [Kofleriaceae bacterium]
MSPPVVNAKRASRRKPAASGRSTRIRSAPTPVEVEPALRADAAANKKTLIDTAAIVFGKEGLGASVETIAKRAGVGIGTLYRHFPTKNALIAAIVATRIEEMAVEAELLADAADPAAAFERIMVRLVETGVVKKDFITALEGAPELTGNAMMICKHRFKGAVGVLVERAQKAGALRDDITAIDVMQLARGVYASAGDDEKARALHLRILLAGLRR